MVAKRFKAYNQIQVRLSLKEPGLNLARVNVYMVTLYIWRKFFRIYITFVETQSWAIPKII